MYKASAIIIVGIFVWVAVYYIFSIATPTVTYVASSDQAHIIETNHVTKDTSITYTILFLGDVMLDRGVAQHAERYGADKLFAGVKELLTSQDAVIANLEGTITDNQSVSAKNNSILRFTFKPTLAVDILKDIKVSAVSQANNHSSDFGKDGYLQTKKYLDQAGITSFGSARNDMHISDSILVSGRNVEGKSVTEPLKICLVGYHDLYTYDATPALLEVDRLKKETLANNENCNLIILFAHWGDEYVQEPSSRQKELAHGFIDAGADLVIGAHPHVVQPYEIYKNKAIFYSLGNFMFDQDFSYNTTHGLAVLMEVSNSKKDMDGVNGANNTNKTGSTNIAKNLTYKQIPISIIQSEASVSNPEDAKKILKVVSGNEAKDKFVLEEE